MLPDNAPISNRHSGYLKLSFISTCVSYIFNILLPVYSTDQLQGKTRMSSTHVLLTSILWVGSQVTHQ